MKSLVSIVVVTYNSSKYIIETLDSIKNQTWREIELIITDDCSKDNTVTLCKEWIKLHQERFHRILIETVTENKGIAANCNRGLFASSGEWIKYCAGDDILFPTCIEDNLSYVLENKSTKVLFSFTKMYLDTFDEKNFLKLNPTITPISIINEEITAQKQYHRLLLSDCITFTPSSFINRQVLVDEGGFNEQMRLQEDYPMWLSLTKKGVKLHFMNKYTVGYRVHEAATNNMKIDYLIKPNYFRTEFFRKQHIYPNLPWDVRGRERFVWIVSQLFRSDFSNRNIEPFRFLYRFLTVWCNPFRWIIYIKKRAVSNLPNEEFYV